MNKLSRKPRSNPLFLKGIKIQGKLVKNKCVTGHNKKEIALSKKNEKMPLVKIEFEYRIFNEKKELLTEATTVLAFMDKATNKPIKCPEYILEKLRD